MHSKIKRLRQRGARRSAREIQSDPGIVGHLTMVGCGGLRELKLHAAPMLFAGYERQGAQDDPNGAALMQEWAVEVMADQPAGLERTSHRPAE